MSVEGRYVEIKSGPKLQLIFKETTRDLTKNIELDDDDDIDSLSSNLLPLFSHASFKTCTLQTLDGDYAFKAASTKLKTNRPTFKSLPSASHNTKKTPLIDPKSPFLYKLGLTDSEGTPKPKSKSKLSQCTKFVEIVSQLIESQKITDQKPIEIVDVGCGKGYLTFSLHNYLTSKNIETISTGVELRESLCDSINSIVSDLVETEPQFETLTFKPGYISSYVHYSKKVDVLIALHACDTASCDAISYGLSLNSTIIVLAPCCHKEVRRQVEGFKGYEGVLGEVMGWGIMRERFSEYVTDSLRGLILEVRNGEQRSVATTITNVRRQSELMSGAMSLFRDAINVEERERRIRVDVSSLLSLFASSLTHS
ncbi:hypothetical protein TL16_g02468 [Triparma laevis f. inornata]|uniref:Methyltransferase domain-containing protein n=1 Tax=Triparma laevis f. inornata TaxID=1714386 RepID=A0A9W7DWU3_9STRA|nr:hypothetical protein TL16_g02468 [Triparma laevis f. inornata]